MTQALIYCRISQDREGAGVGIDTQETDCRALADQLGWTVAAVHTDNDVSAYSHKPRPGYRALLADIENGCAAAVLCWHTDRLHRSPVELESYIDLVERQAVTTHTVKTGHIDLATPTGRMVARQLGAIARYESEHRAERVARARLRQATHGTYGGGVRPFGFESDGTTIRQTEAAEIIKAAEALLSGMSLRALVADLNRRGVPTVKGGRWRPENLRGILARPRNAGIAVYRGEETGQAAWPPIVSEDTFRAVKALLSDPARKATPGNAPRWLGSGLYRCGKCPAVMVVSTSGGSGYRFPAYRCRERHHLTRAAARLDEFVESVIVERLSRPDAADLARSHETEDTAGMHAEANALRTRLDELGDMYADAAMDARQFRRADERIRTRLDDLERRIAIASERNVLAGIADAGDVAAVWEDLDLSRKRAVLDTLMDVTVHPATRKGRLPDGSYFDPESVEVTWRQ